jgi:mycothiol synthase
MLPEGYTVRNGTMDDVQAVVDLMIASDIADYGEPDTDFDGVLLDWQTPGFNPAQDSWLIFAPDGALAGFSDAHLYVEDLEVSIDGYVHPDYRGHGIGTAMLALAESRARDLAATVPGDERVMLRDGTLGTDQPSQQLFLDNGWQKIRHFWRMEIEFDVPPPEPEWPEGITVRAFVPEQDAYATFEAAEDAFADHWNHARPPFEEWERVKIKGADFDASLWFLAMDGGKIAGVSICKYRSDKAWVQTLGVRPAWRRRGIAKALLLHSFGEFYRRGDHRVGLGVDAASPTGATKLYDGVGMKPTQEYVVYEKEARAAKTELA